MPPSPLPRLRILPPHSPPMPQPACVAAKLRVLALSRALRRQQEPASAGCALALSVREVPLNRLRELEPHGAKQTCRPEHDCRSPQVSLEIEIEKRAYGSA